MIIEDSRTDVYLIREAIGRSGIDVEIDVLRDGYEATKYIDAADRGEGGACPDLILLDLNLPKISGDEVLEHLRRSTRSRGARVLIVSSSDAPSDRASAERLGIAGYFKKSSKYAEFMKLGRVIQNLLADSGEGGSQAL